MYRLTCAAVENGDDNIFYSTTGRSLHGMKCRGTKMCRDYGSCNGVLTRYVIEQIDNEYALGDVVFKKTIKR